MEYSRSYRIIDIKKEPIYSIFISPICGWISRLQGDEEMEANLVLDLDRYLAEHRYKYLALYHALRTAILNGGLPGGVRLPSTRRLAEQYGLSRGSASQVYDMLAADGYVRGETGRGTFVSERLSRAGAAAEAPVPDLPLSAWARRLPAGLPATDEPEPAPFISFRSAGMPMEVFPYAEWRSALSHASGRAGGALGLTAPPQGDEGLRRAIAAHLRLTRGIRSDAEDIIIFSGSMQALVLLTQLLLDEGGRAVVEDPGFHGIRRAVTAAGGIPLPGRMDRSGLVPEDWDARLLFVTPSRQYPTGAVLPLDRRRRLLEWAAARRAVIIEDDYDSEFRWSGRPVEPLKALDRGERVVYVGSFSNTMFAGLRIGYAVLPPSLTGPAIRAKALYEPLPAGLLEQRALARFMALGHYARHIRRMSRLFGERGRLLRELLAGLPAGLFEPLPGDAGLHIYARWLRGEEAFARFKEAALLRGADFRDAARYRMEAAEPAACFAFSHLDRSGLREGVRRLAEAWADVQNET
ncbi:HTH-type transcriptional regulatory protein GabR [compost metagenome]